MRAITLLATAAIVLLSSCNSKKSEYDPYKITGSKNKKEVSKTAFEVDFKRTASNLKTIHINLNGNNSYDAIFDTGCSGVLISVQEANDMIKQGTLVPMRDEENPVAATIADGSVSLNRVFKLQEVTVMDKNGQPHTLRDISAMMASDISAEILIGSSVIDNLAKKSYTVDLKRNVIRFE